MATNASRNILMKQYKELTSPETAIPSFHIELQDDNILAWNVAIMVLNKDSVYHGAYFKAQMKFPTTYPFHPPSFKFDPPIYHPNVYKDGRLCISILHQSGDATSDDNDNETWSPAQTVESVLLSVVSLLDEPNPNSPANVDAAVDWRKKPESYRNTVRQEVERSKKDIPEGFEMPDEALAYLPKHHKAEEDPIDDGFWYDGEDDGLDDEEEEEDEEDYSLSDEESIMDDVPREQGNEVEEEGDLTSEDDDEGDK